MKYFIRISIVVIFFCSSCQRDDVNIIDVSFNADKLTVGVNEPIIFKIGSGAQGSSIYTGDINKNFEKSRIFFVEVKNYTEEFLKQNLVAERIPGLKEYLFNVPSTPSTTDFKINDSEIKIYEGKLVKWDVSNATDSKYLQFKLIGGKSQTLVIDAKKSVLPAMLKMTNANLTTLGAQNTVVNSSFQPFCAFPDGFTPQSPREGTSIKIGVQLVIDGKESIISYSIVPIRELLDNLNLNLAPIITDWLIKNPSATPANGIDQVKLIFNADDPALTEDDGPLLDYVGNVYIQEIRLGSADNMVKNFDKGVPIPFVYPKTEYVYPYKYTTKGTYKATLVSTFIGGKKYKGDGYQTSRADEILASEYQIERIMKTIIIKVE